MKKYENRLLSYSDERRQAVIARYMRFLRFNRERFHREQNEQQRFHREQNEQQEQYLLDILNRMECGDVLPVLKDGASSNERFTSETENVFRSIDITVV